MAQRTTLIVVALLLIFLISGCTSALHLVYLDRESEVETAATHERCVKAYSQFDGERWTDFYGPPCNVYLYRYSEKIQEVVPPKGSRH